MGRNSPAEIKALRARQNFQATMQEISLQHWIRKHPMRVMGTAFAVGFLAQRSSSSRLLSANTITLVNLVLRGISGGSQGSSFMDK